MRINTTRLTAIKTGQSLRYDVQSKASVVRQILKSKPKSKAQFTKIIESIATQLNVNPVTVRVWCKKYQFTYEAYYTLPAGIVSIKDTIIPGQHIATVSKYLAGLRNKGEQFAEKYEIAPNSAVGVKTTKKAHQSTIDELLNLTGTKQ